MDEERHLKIRKEFASVNENIACIEACLESLRFDVADLQISKEDIEKKNSV